MRFCSKPCVKSGRSKVESLFRTIVLFALAKGLQSRVADFPTSYLEGKF